VVLTLFYIIPIAWAAWFVHRREGWLLSILSAIFATYTTEIQSGFLASQPLLIAWAFLTRLVLFLIISSVVSRLHETLHRSEELSMTDDLTKAFNGRAFFDLLQKELLRSRRYGHPLTVVYLDLDNFKAVNDSLGHQTGNTVLKQVVAVMKQAVRCPDSIARLGGDEFAILLPETDADSAKALLPRIQDSLLAAMRNNQWPVTFSIGVLTCTDADCSSDEIFRRVDTLMYSVKHRGKNGIHYEVLAGGSSVPA
jgi:diguanylate cyclase (GGDEF)-like protein